MIKHMVLFSFREDAPRDKIKALLEEYPIFPKRHPQMLSLHIGRNQSWRDDHFEYAFVCEFKSFDDLDLYLKSSEHEEHVRERFRPLIKERAIVSFEYDAGAAV